MWYRVSQRHFSRTGIIDAYGRCFILMIVRREKCAHHHKFLDKNSLLKGQRTNKWHCAAQ